MRHFTAVALFLAGLSFSTTDVISNRYCADMQPQSYVTVEQLMGMWYGVEVINHQRHQERVGVQEIDSCPIIHISENHSPTVPPYYKGNAQGPYGGTHGTHYGTTQYQLKNTDYNRDPYSQDSYRQVPTTYYDPQGTGHKDSTNYQGRIYGSEEFYTRRYADEIKRLLLLWADNGDRVEYTLRYNNTKPGFWISSGPHNGSALEPQFDQFAGTIQVIKAVGNHLVLTFCHQLPDQQLFTVILSRIPRLTRHEISDVHDLLTAKALETHNIKRVCSQNNFNSAFAFTTNKFTLMALPLLVFFAASRSIRMFLI